jgi:Fe-S-cluster formation regulator IscX/YfhJ
MTEQYDSLGEQTKLVDISLKYTRGDIDKAKAMAAGQYQDIGVIKGKFYDSESGESGLFFAFINTQDEYIANITTLLSFNASIFERVRIFDHWKSLLNDANGYKDGTDIIDSSGFQDALLDKLISVDIFPDVQEENLAELVRKVNLALKEYYNVEDVKCQVELNVTNSLTLEMEGLVIDLPDFGDEQQEAEEKPLEPVYEDERIKNIEQEAKYIVQGSIIVSPVSGKYVNDIEPGEIIKVLLPGKDAVTRKLIEVLNATNDEGTVVPVKGRLKAKIPQEKSGYILYALVAKGVLAKIIEEENVKIQVDDSVKKEVEKSKMDSKLLIAIAVVIGLLIIGGIVAINLL